MNTRNTRSVAALGLILAISTASAFDAIKDRPTPPKNIFGETEAQRDARRAWWTHDRFGMFIHFGLYSVLGRHEWVQSHERIAPAPKVTAALSAAPAGHRPVRPAVRRPPWRVGRPPQDRHSTAPSPPVHAPERNTRPSCAGVRRGVTEACRGLDPTNPLSQARWFSSFFNAVAGLCADGSTPPHHPRQRAARTLQRSFLSTRATPGFGRRA